MHIDFQKTADEFIERVKTATIGPNTEVAVVYYCHDGYGNPIPPFRMSMVGTTSVTVPGDPGFAKNWAAKIHVDTIIGNINSLVRPSTMQRFSVPREVAHVPMLLERIDLEIKEGLAGENTW
jgi:hypothetical protein